MLLVLFAPEEYLAARKLQDGKYVFAPSGKRSKGITVRGLMQILLVTVLVLNINTALVTESTGLNTDEIVGYSNVNAVHEQSNTVKCLTGEDDDILFIAQKGAERSLHRARFDVGMNVSGYSPNTYHFSETADAGYDLSVIRSPKELPQLLIDGGYEYVWVYKTDTELNDFAEGYFGMKLKNATLYRVFVQNGTVTLSRVSGLE